jgi:hypothetical protein
LSLCVYAPCFCSWVCRDLGGHGSLAISSVKT